jgi:hypothetical protein
MSPSIRQPFPTTRVSIRYGGNTRRIAERRIVDDCNGAWTARTLLCLDMGNAK